MTANLGKKVKRNQGGGTIRADLKFVATGSRVKFLPAVSILPENNVLSCKIYVEVQDLSLTSVISHQNC